MTAHSVPHSFGKGVLYMTLSAFWFALTYLFVKLCSGKFPFFLFTFARFLIPAVVLLIVVLYQKQFLACFRIKNFHTHLLRAIFVAIAQFSIFYYLSKSSLVNATVLLNTGPLFIPLIEWLTLGNPIGKSTAVSLLVAFAGVILILQPEADLFSLLSLIGIIAGFSQACSQVLYGVHTAQEKTIVNLFLLYALSTLISLIPFLISYFFFSFEIEKYAMLWTFESWYLFVFLLILSFANVFNQYFRGQAYHFGGKPSTLSTFLYLAVFFAAFYDWLVFGIEPNLYTVLGALLVIGSSILKIVMRHYILKKRES